jgi:hypothetical protein
MFAITLLELWLGLVANMYADQSTSVDIPERVMLDETVMGPRDVQAYL